jgi:hypothetical protein
VHRAAIWKGNVWGRGQGQTAMSEKFSFRSQPMETRHATDEKLPKGKGRCFQTCRRAG